MAENNYELRLYEKILPLIFNSNNIKVYADSSAKDIVEKSLIFHSKKDCEDIDLIIVKKIGQLDERCKSLPVFATHYKTYVNSLNSIGVFYWRKGRPQLKLNTKVIKKFKLTLPPSLKEYAQ